MCREFLISIVLSWLRLGSLEQLLCSLWICHIFGACLCVCAFGLMLEFTCRIFRPISIVGRHLNCLPASCGILRTKKLVSGNWVMGDYFAYATMYAPFCDESCSQRPPLQL